MAAGLPVETKRFGHTLLITINRPQARNAVNREVAELISTALEELSTDPELLVGVLAGVGGHFCSGVDLKALAAEGFPRIGNRGLAGLTRAELDKPMVAAVEGYAVSGGCELALACDLIVAAESAKFALSEVTKGAVPSEGGVQRLLRKLPRQIAMGMLLTGDPLSAAHAARYGMVNWLAPDGQAIAAGLELADQVGRNAPLAVAAVRQLARETEGHTEAEAWTVQDRIVKPVLDSEDAKEGVAAFQEKRQPVWRGR
ncbi:enoyl-CoA hydratase [Pseudonocardiaceae bacterium YIM PH 21723]|nr:enoyl-CoA hydratase [Pseudonocardiaceae bacterium YIM PH 21723]